TGTARFAVFRGAGPGSTRRQTSPQVILEVRPVPDAVLSILAHPDDAEFLCAGALIRLQRERGWDVHIASMTPGDCGSAEQGAEEISRIRRAEGARAAAITGGHYHCLEERDLLIF